MQRDCLFFAGLKGAVLPLKKAPGFNIFESFYLITNHRDKDRIVSPYIRQIGTLERDFLLSPKTALIYENSQVILDEADNLGERANGLVVAKLAKVQNWLNKLWLLKDHAINHDVGFVALHVDDNFQITSNVWEASFSQANGSNDEVKLSHKEIEFAKGFNLMSEYGDDVGPIELHKPGYHGMRPTKLDDKGGRIERFLYFTTGARAAQDLGIKVALYSSALEALVSSAHSEIIHQVAERTAVALGDDLESRTSIYRQVKQAYAMRSKAVHGAVIRTKSLPKLITACMDLDRICRALAIKFFKDADFKESALGEDSEFNDYWVRAVLR